MAKDDFRGKPQVTLLEARLRESVDQVEKVNGTGQEAGQPFYQTFEGRSLDCGNAFVHHVRVILPVVGGCFVAVGTPTTNPAPNPSSTAAASKRMGVKLDVGFPTA
jgi:hypothetical protein